MAKKFYTLEKFNNSNIFPFFIGGFSGDVLCAKEEDAQMVVDALNLLREMLKVKRKAEKMAGSLESFLIAANAV